MRTARFNGHLYWGCESRGRGVESRGRGVCQGDVTSGVCVQGGVHPLSNYMLGYIHPKCMLGYTPIPRGKTDTCKILPSQNYSCGR